MPFLGMLLLTLAVWVLLYVRRLRHVRNQRIRATDLTSPNAMERRLPEYVNLPAYNLRNLCELPVVFYTMCLYLFVTNGVDTLHLFCAWFFWGFRVAHSLVHVTSNFVPLRFALYVAASLALWLMVIRAALAVLFH